MFIRRNLVFFLALLSLGALAQNKIPQSHLGSAPLSSSCVVSNLPPDSPDTTFFFHAEPKEPDERDPRFIFHKRKLPNPSWGNYFEDESRKSLNKTNSGDLKLGATSLAVQTTGWKLRSRIEATFEWMALSVKIDHETTKVAPGI